MWGSRSARRPICSSTQKLDDATKGRRVLHARTCGHRRTGPVRRGNPLGQVLTVLRRGDAVEAPAADRASGSDVRRVDPRCRGGAGLQAAGPCPARAVPDRRRWAWRPPGICSIMSTRFAHSASLPIRPSGPQRTSAISMRTLDPLPTGQARADRATGRRTRPHLPMRVQASTNRRTRSGRVTANSWATMPPKETPMTRQDSQPTASSRAGCISAVLGH